MCNPGFLATPMNNIIQSANCFVTVAAIKIAVQYGHGQCCLAVRV